MKAFVYDRYGSPDILELKEVDRPTVADEQLLVRVRAAGINPYDWHLLRGDPYLVRMVGGLRRPRKATIAGSDIAGVVEAVGKNVTRFRPGDEVYACVNVGGYAQYVCAPQTLVAQKPANLTFEQAAAVPMAAITALQGLRDAGRLQAGQTVLVNGAGGGIGHFAVQLAKALGAAEVTGVCSTGKVELVRSIGADHVIDYTREDFTRSGARYDMVFDTAGNHSIRAFRRALKPKGTFVIVGGAAAARGKLLGPGAQVIRAVLLSPLVRNQRIVTVAAKPSGQDLEFLRGLIEAGKVTPVVDRTFPFAEAPEAIRYLEQGHASGKVVVSVWDGAAAIG